MNTKKSERDSFVRIHFKQIGSTNDYAKAQREQRKNLLVTADRQTGGRGTKGRSFSSDEGGVYLTKLTFYERFPAKDAFLLMANAATAVCRTLAFYGLSPKIKWANDVYVNGKKICGILIENVFSGERISSSVVGIGLNVSNALPKELDGIATTLERETGKRIAVEEVREKLVDELFADSDMDEYLSFIGYMGGEATLLFGEERVAAKLLSVDREGGLLVEIAGEKRRVTAAEVSVRIR